MTQITSDKKRFRDKLNVITRNENELKKMTSNLVNCDNAASSNKSDRRAAPDGGYGWLIVIAYGTANVSKCVRGRL